jgi:Mor family transcriptional regulator
MIPIPFQKTNQDRIVGPQKLMSSDPSNNVTSFRGNDPTYILRRLKKERPELAIKVIDGELSAHAAAVEAGWIKAAKPLAKILDLLPKLTPEEIGELITAAYKAATVPAPVKNRKATKKKLNGGGDRKQRRQRSTISDAERADIIKRYKNGETQAHLAKEYGFSYITVNRIIKKSKQLAA